MNQSNKKNLEFIINSGVNYFLQDSPRNWFENEKKLEQPSFDKDTGDKKSKIDGTIDFINGNKMFLSDSIYNHQPRVGDVILFPHYLMHTAYPFKSTGERRSFSFNLEIDSKIANVFSR